MMRIDEFFEKQPEPKFIDWLNSPLHESAPEIFGDRECDAGEVCAYGAYIASVYEPYREVIETATADFEKFLKVCDNLKELVDEPWSTEISKKLRKSSISHEKKCRY